MLAQPPETGPARHLMGTGTICSINRAISGIPVGVFVLEYLKKEAFREL